MGKVIVAEFITLDGVVEDPDGSGGLPEGGWAFHAGPEVFAGDKFGLGPILATGALLLGRVTWELFASRWPSRSGGFADAMNAVAKVVVSHRQLDLDAWSNSSALDGDLVDGVEQLATDRDVAIAGSTSVVHQLAAADLVDEYRLITVPVALGAGRQLFAAPAALRLVSVDTADTTLLARYERSPRPAEEG